MLTKTELHWQAAERRLIFFILLKPLMLLHLPIY